MAERKLAAVAGDTGDAARQVAAFEELVNDFGNDGAQPAIGTIAY